MSDDPSGGIRERLREKYDNVHSLREFEIYGLESGQQDELGLVLFQNSPYSPLGSHAFVTDGRTLLDLARHILRELDPVTNVELLEKIRKLLDEQG